MATLFVLLTMAGSVHAACDDQATGRAAVRCVEERISSLQVALDRAEARIKKLESTPVFGGMFQRTDTGIATNQYNNPLTGGLGCPPGFAAHHVGRVTAPDVGIGANQYLCLKQ